MNIFVGNLAREVTQEDLEKAFGEFGQINSVNIIKDKFSGESRGFGFVEISSNTEAQAAIDGLNGKELKGRKLNINEARPKSDNRRGGGGKPGHGGGRGGRGGGRGGRGRF